MKKLMILSPIHAAMLLAVLFLTSCGGGDDSPTGPESGGDGEGAAGGPTGRLDSRLFGTWITQESSEEEEEGGTLTFMDDGTWIARREGETDTVKGLWWIEGGQLMSAYPNSVFRYAIQNRKLTLTPEGDVSSEVLEFTADGNPRGLTGVTWVDEAGDELVFSSDGTFGSESGVWTAEGGILTVYEEPEAYNYEIEGQTLTLSIDDWWLVANRQ